MLYLFWHKMKVNEKQVKNGKKLFLVINYFVKNAISTTFSQQILSGRLLLVFIVGAKK